MIHVFLHQPKVHSISCNENGVMKSSNVDLDVIDELCLFDVSHKKSDLSLHAIENVNMALSKGGCKLGGYSSFFIGEF